MASAANNEAYGNPAWGAGPQAGPSAWGGPGGGSAGGSTGGFGGGPGGGQAWQGQGPNPGWQQHNGWTPPPFWYPAGISRPVAIVFTVLGFVFWWPVGLAMLVYMVASRRLGCGGRRRGWAMQGWQQGDGSAGGPMGGGPFGGSPMGGNGWTPPWKAWCSPGSSAPPSSGNRAFDEYRAETLRRLEEEQQEFGSFLDRLRFAKDKAEFDAFMAERRQQPPAPPTPPQDPSHA